MSETVVVTFPSENERLRMYAEMIKKLSEENGK